MNKNALKLVMCLIAWLAGSQLTNLIIFMTSFGPSNVFTQEALAQEFFLVQSGSTDNILRPDVELVATNGAFEFNGLDQSINLGRSPILDLADGDFTVHAWVNFASLTNGGSLCFGPGCDMSIANKMASFFEPNDDGWYLLKQSDNHFWFCLGGGASGNGCQGGGFPTTVISQTVAVPHMWYSVAVVKTSSTISIFVNGVLEATSQYGAFTDTNAIDLRIGSIDGDAFLHGRVGQVELFRRALSDGQVQAIYARSKAKYEN